MSETAPGQPARSPSALPILIFLIVVAGVSWAAFEWWRAPQRVWNSPEVDLEYYLKIKKAGLIQEVWVEGTRLTARLKPGAVIFQSRERIDYIRADVPRAVIADPKAFKELMDGLPPDKFHYDAGR